MDKSIVVIDYYCCNRKIYGTFTIWTKTINLSIEHYTKKTRNISYCDHDLPKNTANWAKPIQINSGQLHSLRSESNFWFMEHLTLKLLPSSHFISFVHWLVQSTLSPNWNQYMCTLTFILKWFLFFACIFNSTQELSAILVGCGSEPLYFT